MNISYFQKLLILCVLLMSFGSITAQNLGEFCEDAIPISEGIHAVENGITGSSASNLCFGSGGEASIWYSYTPTLTGDLNISSSMDPNLTDTRVSVYTGNCNELECIASDDDSGEEYTSEVTLEVVAGEPIIIEWDDRWTSQAFVFAIVEIETIVVGCMDPEAINYNPDAILDDGSCLYEFECDENTLVIHSIPINPSIGSFVPSASGWIITDADGNVYVEGDIAHEVMVCVPDGCYSLNMYSPNGQGWQDTSMVISMNGVELAVGSLEDGYSGNLTFGVNQDDCEDIAISIPGCTDPEASNYEPYANTDNDSCQYPFVCDDGEAVSLYVEASANGQVIDFEITNSQGNVVYSQAGFVNYIGVYQQLCLMEEECYIVNMSSNAGPNDWYEGHYWISYNGNEISSGELQYGEEFGPVLFSVDGNCEYLSGCTDPEALNYQEFANVDDGSCNYPFVCDDGVAVELYVGTFGNGEEIDLEIVDSQGNVIYSQASFGNHVAMYQDLCLMEGECYTVNMSNNTGPNGWWGGYYWINYNGSEISTGDLHDGEEFGSVDFSVDGTCGNLPGCTDPEAINYNPYAILDDDSCLYEDVCDENTLVIYPIIIDPITPCYTCFNWSSSTGWIITDADGNVYGEGIVAEEVMICIPDGCYSLNMYSPNGQGWQDTSAVISMNGVELAVGSLEDGYSGNLTFGVNQDDCEDIAISIPGCADPEASNYQEFANVDDGSCNYPCNDGEEVSLYVEASANGQDIDFEITNSQGNVVYSQAGFVNSIGVYQLLCLMEEECYTVNMSSNTGPNDWYEGHYWIINNGDEISSGELQYGEEFGPVDFSVDGTCGDLQGCTDPEASNYNPAATVDDGSCYYPFACDDGVPAEFYLCTFDNGANVGIEIIGDNGDIIFSQDGFSNLDIMYENICLEEEVCYTVTMTNNSGENGWYGGYYWINLGGVTVSTGFLSEDQSTETLTFSIDGTCGDVFGCTDPTALNYNALATADDGSCFYLPPPEDCQASFEILSIDTENNIMYILNTSPFGLGFEYLWDFGDGATSTAPLPIHTYSEDGEYTICLTLTGLDNCEETFCLDIFYEGAGVIDGGSDVRSNSGFSINVVNSVDGIVENSNLFNNLILFPNPAQNELTVQFNLATVGDVQMTFYDYTGANVKSETLSQHDTFFNRTIDLQDLSSGFYFVELMVNGERMVKKFNVVK